MDTKILQGILVEEGFLTSGSYEEGVMDSKTKKAVDKLLKLTNSDDIVVAISKYRDSDPKSSSNKVLSDKNQTISIPKNYSKSKGSSGSSNSSSRYKTPAKSRKSKASFQVDQIECYIQNLKTSYVINFMVESPDSISESVGADFSSTSTRGRSHPYMSYSNSRGRSIDFTLELYDDYCEKGLRQTVNELKALTYPVASGDRIVSPECRVVIGNTVRMEKAVISNVSVTWKKPYREGLYLGASVSISVSEIVDKSVLQPDVVGGA